MTRIGFAGRGALLSFAVISIAVAAACSRDVPQTALSAPPDRDTLPKLDTALLRDSVPRADTVLISENRQAGLADWYTINTAAQSELAMWVSPYAPRAGDSLDLRIHSTAGPVAVQIYRIGWYGGAGARRIRTIEGVAAGPQPDCELNEPVVCRWAATTRIKVGADWVSGLYFIKLIDRRGLVAYHPFVVSDPSPATFTAVIPQFTWQAYNDFGGRSLYTYIGDIRGHKVSFERPYKQNAGASLTVSAVGSHEISAIHWLERNNYDVKYISDVDVAHGDFQPTRGLLFIGHDEYWTHDEFSLVESARNHRTHLAFLSGNNAYRAVRLSRGDFTGRPEQVITCFNAEFDVEATSQSQTTRAFRDEPLNRPENALYGIQYSRIASSTEFPIFVADSGLGREARAFLDAAGMHERDTVRALSVSPAPTPATSFEGDQIAQNGLTPSNLQVLLRQNYPFYPREQGGTTTFHTTFFIAHGGAGVFAAGVNEWGRWLDSHQGPENQTIQRITAAVLDWMKIH